MKKNSLKIIKLLNQMRGVFFSSELIQHSETDNNHHPLENISSELMIMLILNLSPESIVKFGFTSKYFHEISKDNVLWKIKYITHFPHRMNEISDQATADWYSLFKKTHHEEYHLLYSSVLKKAFSLVKECDVSSLKKLNLRYSDLNKCDVNGISLLYWAVIKLIVARNNSDQEKFIEAQMVLNYFYELSVEQFFSQTIVYDARGRRQLHFAVLCNQSEDIIKELISAQVRRLTDKFLNITPKFIANEPTRSGFTPLMLAIETRNPILTALFLEYEPNINETLRSTADHMINYHLEIGNVSLHMPITQLDSFHERNSSCNFVNVENNRLTALHLAAASGDTRIMKLLLDKKYDINNSYVTPLFVAVQYNHVEMAALLLPHTTEINRQVPMNSSYIAKFIIDQHDTALHVAVRLNNLNMIKLLLTHKNIDITLINFANHTPLRLAIEFGYIESLKLLIENGSNINDKTPNGASSLLIAVENNQIEIVKFLLQKEIDVNAQLEVASDYHIGYSIIAGDTALHAAIKLNHLEIIKLLIAHPTIKLDIRNNDRLAPLEFAAKLGRVDVAELLINKDGEIKEISTVTYNCSLLSAIENNHVEFVKTLLHYNVINTHATICHEAIRLANELNNDVIVNLLLSADPNLLFTLPGMKSKGARFGLSSQQKISFWNSNKKEDEFITPQNDNYLKFEL